jgi:rubrerythrin
MEISEHELARLVAEVDDRHRAAMATAAHDLAEHHLRGGEAGASRRQFLRRAALGGMAITVGSAVIPVSGLLASAGAATNAPTDPTLVAFAESIELALVSAYNSAMATAPVGGPVKNLFTSFAGHHQQHAAALATLGASIGAKSTHQPNAKLLEVAMGQFHAATDEKHVLGVGELLETSSESTYLSALGSLTRQDARKLSDSIMPVESQHAVAFAVAAGKAVADACPAFVTTDRAVDPTKYAVS